MIDTPSTRVGKTLPGLHLIRDEVIQSTPLKARINTVFKREGIKVWNDVLELTPELLLDLRGLGTGSVRDFLAVAVKASAEAYSHRSLSSEATMIPVVKGDCYPPETTSFIINQFRRLAEWAVNETDANSINDLLRAVVQSDLPEDISSLCGSVRATNLTDVFPEIIQQEALESLVDGLCAILDERSRLIFLGRISLDKCRTLDDLGKDIGVTKERVRQLEQDAVADIRKALETLRFTPLSWRAHTLRRKLGTAAARHILTK